jgi:hypothetical protein
MGKSSWRLPAGLGDPFMFAWLRVYVVIDGISGSYRGIMFTLGRLQCQNAENIGLPCIWPYSCIQKYTMPRYSSHHEDRTLSPLDHSLSIHAISYSATQCSLRL